jgi:hypothetical protein
MNRMDVNYQSKLLAYRHNTGFLRSLPLQRLCSGVLFTY